MKNGMKKAETAIPAKTESGAAPRTAALVALMAPYLTAGVLLVIATGLLLQLYLGAAGASRDSAAREQRLAGYAAAVQAKIANSQAELLGLAADPAVKAALLSGDGAQMQAQAERIAQAFTELHAVRLVPPGLNAAEPDSKPAISNVTLNLLRQAERGELPAPELLLPGQAGAHIAVMAPVREGSVVHGVVLAGFKLERAQALAKDLPALPGYLEIVQPGGTAVSVLGSLGDAALKDGEPLTVADVPGTLWKLHYWAAGSDPLAGNNDRLVLLAALAVLALGLIGVLWYSQQVLARELQADGSRLLKWLMDGYGRRLREPGSLFKTRLFADISSALARASNERVPEEKTPVATRAGLAASSARTGLTDALEVSMIEEVSVSEQRPMLEIDKSIFRAYDIRGVVDKQLTPDVVRQIGRAIGSEAYDRGEQKVIVARDGRLSGPSLLEALKQGLMESGRDVIDIGEVPTPVLYFATHYLDARSGVMLTGSHNPKDFNGLKMVLAGETLSGDDIQKLYQRIVKNDLMSGKGNQEKANILGDYIGQITGDVALAQHLKIVIDCGNGVAGKVAPELYRALGCEVIELYCEVDGNFPNHHPDPSKPANLKELIERVKSEGADIGLAFDGDGDRLGVVASDGTIIWPDRQMMLFAMDLLSRHPGSDVIFDVKCTRGLAKVISGHGGRPLMWKTGHSLIKAKMRETGALLAGERSGHIFIKERWYGFDDGLYAGARLLEILALDFRKSAEIFSILPDAPSTPELNLDIADDKKFQFVEELAKRAQFHGGEVNTIDGVRVDWADGWGLVRASNTTPCLVIRFEADDEQAMKRIQAQFRTQMLGLDAALQLPF